MILKYHLEKMDKIKKEKQMIYCKDCKHFREQTWNDFCYYWGTRITKAYRKFCRGFEKKEESKEEIIKNLENEFKGCELWGVWSRKCWKCGKDIKVAINTTGWSFNPFDLLSASSKAEKIFEILKKMGVNMKLKFSKTIGKSYIGNVCPYCDALQGNWFLNDELSYHIYVPENDFKLLVFKDNNLIDEFSNFEEFEKKYWKAFLLREIRCLEECEICGRYITFSPQTFEDFLKKYPESKEILEKFGKIEKRIVHHISYNPEMIVNICSSCHAKIHHSKNPKYNKFRPRNKK
jgi:succinate dehydrogenase/fumarate reductase-like Fe-S protein